MGPWLDERGRAEPLLNEEVRVEAGSARYTKPEENVDSIGQREHRQRTVRARNVARNGQIESLEAQWSTHAHLVGEEVNGEY